MSVAFDRAGVTVLIGDAQEQLRSIETESVQTVVTSPPYYGLRDYGVDGQIGLEPTLGEFLDSLLGVFAEVHRVLRPDGTMWVNMGDSYAGPPGQFVGNFHDRYYGSEVVAPKNVARPRPPRVQHGLPAKNLVGVPWRLAFALQDAGWILRQDIIWSKPNPMPESVKDRCTKAHEYLFLFSKNPRYYFDAEAIGEPITDTTMARLAQNVDAQLGSDRIPGKNNGRMKAAPPRFPSGWQSGEGGHSVIGHNQPKMGGTKYGERPDEFARTKSGKEHISNGRRNKRSVWTIAPEPTSEAHFATFPEKLVEPCVLAGSRPGDVVLDPFVGSGTTIHVAHRLNRKAIGVELNPEYLPLITNPLAQQVLPLENVS